MACKGSQWRALFNPSTYLRAACTQMLPPASGCTSVKAEDR